MGTAIKHPVTVPDRVKPSFVIFDILALWRSVLSVRVPGCQKLQMTNGLTRSGTGCFIAVPIIPYGNSGRQRVKLMLISYVTSEQRGGGLLCRWEWVVNWHWKWSITTNSLPSVNRSLNPLRRTLDIGRGRSALRSVTTTSGADWLIS